VAKEAARPGKCSTCQSTDDFCEICGWWELGPRETLGIETAELAAEALQPQSNLEKCHDVGKEYALCTLMTEQWSASTTFKAKDYEIQLWGPGRNATAPMHAMAWIERFPPDLEAPIARRLGAMFLTYASAYQHCLEQQFARMALNDPAALLSLHDTAAIAAKHYALHEGFWTCKTQKELQLDCLTLRHVDTIEQYLKKNMASNIAAWLLKSDAGASAGDVAVRALLLYLALLTIAAPWESQKVPSPKTFSPADNLASGIFPANHIEACLKDGAVSLAVVAKLKELLDALLTMPDLAKRPFRFNTEQSDARIVGRNLSPRQELYLRSMQDLDADDCPSACKEVLLDRATKNLAALMKPLKAAKNLRKLVTIIGADISFLTEPAFASALVEKFIQYGRDGRLPLQTSANDVSFIAKKPYVGIFALHAAPCTVADVLRHCELAKNGKEPFTGCSYARQNVEKASDTRQKVPYQYLSWRMQKDRAAHKFFPMAYDDYEVTAAIAQGYPVPQPELTYGPQTIVWKPAVIPFCTFKVGDSGRPTRSFLQLLDMLLDSSKDLKVRQSLFNLLLRLLVMPDSFGHSFGNGLGKKAITLPMSPPSGLDVEVHIYGPVTAVLVEGILYPFNEDEDLRDKLSFTFGKLPVALYDVDTLRKRQQDQDNEVDWMSALAL
jgi:hypothetical protein